MPIDVRYIDEDRGVVLTIRGNVSGSEMIDANNKVYSSKKSMQRLRYGYIDLSGAEEMHVSQHEVQILAKQSREASAIVKEKTNAIVATSDLAYGISRMWLALVDNIGWDNAVFRSEAQAKKWLKETVHQKDGFDISLN